MRDVARIARWVAALGVAALGLAAVSADAAPAGTSLLESVKSENTAESWKGQTALMWAAAENHAEVVRALVGAGADIKTRSKGGVFTPYLFAVRGGQIEAARALLEAGVNVNETLPDGTSALVLA